jgi:hypothetical protein
LHLVQGRNRERGVIMRSTTTERPPITDDAEDSEVAPGAGEARPAETRRRRPSRKTAIAIVALAVVGSLVLRLSGGDDDPAATTTAGALAVGGEDATQDEPLPPRPVLPQQCVLADAAFVIELMEHVRIPGGGGVDNPFVSDADGAFDRVVAARILGGESTGELGLWGVTPEGRFVPLNDVTATITPTADDGAKVVDGSEATDATALVTKCTKLSTGG